MEKIVGGTAAVATAQNREKSRAGSRVNVEEMYVDPMCINASNAYHQCTENCLQRNKKRIQIKEGKRVQNGEIREEVVGEKYVDFKYTPDTGITVQIGEISEEVVGEKYVDSKKTPDTRRQSMGGNSGHAIQNRERGEEARVANGRNVDPMCVNASNPYHRCAEYCLQRSHVTTKKTGVSRLEGSMEYKKIGENRNVNPRCVNASNPYHKCGEYCLQRRHKVGLVAGGKPEGNKGGLKKVERTDVNPKCRHGSNPYHKCTDNCLQRIKGAT